MRVLWFTNTPSLASDYLHVDSQGGGWISSLEKRISTLANDELGVAFHHDTENINQFKIGETTYYSLPIHEPKNKLWRFFSRWVHRIEPNSVLADYLKVIREFRPDIIHIFGTEQAFGLITEYIRIPVIVQIQGNLNAILNKWFLGINKFQLIRYSDLSLFIHAYSNWHEYLLLKKKTEREKVIFSNCKFFIGRTEWDKYITKALSENGKYFQCEELMREEFYLRRWTSLLSTKIVLFSTLNPSVYKGLEIVLMVASLLKNKLRQNFEWRIAGISYEAEIVSIIQKSLKKKFDNNNVLFLGSLNTASLIDNLLKANCYVHPSHIENSPNSVCEAMLLGMPIVASYVGGIPSLIQDKKEGLLIPDGDPYAFVGAILEIMMNPDYAINLGNNARQRALIRHDPEKIVEELFSIYEKVISKEPNPSIN